MFSPDEKGLIARILENVILSLDHPEMPKERPKFRLHVDGIDDDSWADIVPNWEHNKE
jgi:hypothetical protein